jgi:hypothetical protein
MKVRCSLWITGSVQEVACVVVLDSFRVADRIGVAHRQDNRNMPTFTHL